MKPVIQQDTTGCGVACSAAIAGVSYESAKQIANDLGISVDDPALWSETKYVRRLLLRLGIRVNEKEVPFSGWRQLPNCALLAIKWRQKNDKPYWHWVVFVRDEEETYVLDPKNSLKRNIRTDFGRMEPKWFIEVNA